MGLGPGWSDAEILTVLDLYHGDGLSAGQVSERTGRSRSSICAQLMRVRDADAAVPDLCRDPANLDGAMGRRWWKR